MPYKSGISGFVNPMPKPPSKASQAVFLHADETLNSTQSINVFRIISSWFDATEAKAWQKKFPSE